MDAAPDRRRRPRFSPMTGKASEFLPGGTIWMLSVFPPPPSPHGVPEERSCQRPAEKTKIWFSGSDLDFHLEGRKRSDVPGAGSQPGARRPSPEGSPRKLRGLTEPS